ncbi:MAG: hypothetical protein RL701_3379 [Pseudomonadota bacterium]
MRTAVQRADSEPDRGYSPRRSRLVVLLAAVLCFSCSVAKADDPRSTYLIKLLQGSSQFRVRAQAAISLGSIEGASTTVEALAGALRDTHPAVRAAAATALGRVGDASVVATLRALERDSEEPVRSAAKTSLARLASVKPPPTRDSGLATTAAVAVAPLPAGPPLYYVAVAEPGTRVTKVDKQLLAQARTFIRQRVGQIQGVRLAPDSESHQAAEKVLKTERLKGFYLDSSIVSAETKPSGETRVAVSIIVATYPGRDMRAIMQGAATVTGSGSQNYHQAVEGAFNGALRQLSQAMAR